jgi:tetratricopeptide (TPR) repeat protein
VEYKNVIDEKNLQTTLHQMQRSRDKAVLKPYLEFIRDSLTKEVNALTVQKNEIEQKINSAQPIVIPDSVVISENKQLQEKTESKNEASISAAHTNESPDKKHDSKYDKVTVVDLGTSKPKLKPEPERHKKQTAHKDTIVTVAKADTLVPEQKDTTAQAKEEAKANLNAKKNSVASVNADSVKIIKAEFFMKRALKAIAEKKTADARSYMEKAVDLYPNYYEAWLALGDLETNSGSFTQALKDYKACLKIDSSNANLYYGMGTLYKKMKQSNESFRCYEKAIQLDPNNILSRMAHAAILTEWKNYNEAVAEYDKILSANRTYRNAYRERGMVKFLSKSYSDAVDDFTRYLLFDQSDASVYYYRGLCKVANSELLDGCLDLSTAAEMGYEGAEKAIKNSCE